MGAITRYTHLLTDLLPDDPSHLVSIELDDGFRNDDFLPISCWSRFSALGHWYVMVWYRRRGVQNPDTACLLICYADDRLLRYTPTAIICKI